MEDSEEKCILTTRLVRKQSEQATNDIKSTGRRLHFCKVGYPCMDDADKAPLVLYLSDIDSSCRGEKGSIYP